MFNAGSYRVARNDPASLGSGTTLKAWFESAMLRASFANASIMKTSPILKNKQPNAHRSFLRKRSCARQGGRRICRRSTSRRFVFSMETLFAGCGGGAPFVHPRFAIVQHTGEDDRGRSEQAISVLKRALVKPTSRGDIPRLRPAQSCQERCPDQICFPHRYSSYIFSRHLILQRSLSELRIFDPDYLVLRVTT